MNPYARLALNVGTPEASSLCQRLAAWHDAMVTHERRRRTTQTRERCQDDCPHAEARALWREALAVLGASASQLSFLRSHGLSGVDFASFADATASAVAER